MVITCNYCGKEFHGQEGRKFCSRECSNASKKNPKSEPVKEYDVMDDILEDLVKGESKLLLKNPEVVKELKAPKVSFNNDDSSDDELKIPDIDVTKIDFDKPLEVKKLKELIVQHAFRASTHSNAIYHKQAAALKNVVDIIIQLEKDWNVSRESQLLLIQDKLNGLEGIIDSLTAENSQLQSKIAQYERDARIDENE